MSANAARPDAPPTIDEVWALAARAGLPGGRGVWLRFLLLAPRVPATELVRLRAVLTRAVAPPRLEELAEPVLTEEAELERLVAEAEDEIAKRSLRWPS